MNGEEFTIGGSRIHRTDPRAKIFAAFYFSMVVAVSERFTTLLPAACLGVILLIAAGLPLKKVFDRLLKVNVLVLVLWFFLPFTYGDQPLFSIGPMVGTREGVHYAAIITIKSNTIILALLSLVATMSVFTLGRSLQFFRVPDKVVYLLFLTFRYTHVLFQEYNRLLSAIKIRGFRAGNNVHTYRTYAYLVGMLFIKSYDRAERVRAAMLCRGFKGKLYSLNEFRFQKWDGVFLLVMLSAVTGISFLEWTAG